MNANILIADFTIKGPYLQLGLIAVGIVLFLYAVYPLCVQGLKLGTLLLGLVFLVGGLLVAGGSSPTPTPGPTPPGPAPPGPAPPGPTPPPIPPITPFGTQVIQAFQSAAGTPAEAQILSALHTNMGEGLVWDGTLAKPGIDTTTKMGEVFARTQSYRGRVPNPWGTKFDAMERVIAEEARKRGIIGQAAGPFDANKRAMASNFYKEIGAILAGVQ